MPNDVFEFLDGKPYILEGISGYLKYDSYRAIYPYEHTVEKLSHIPDSEGKKSLYYQSIRVYLGDDWDTDLTNDIEAYCNIALELGYNYVETIQGS